MQALKIWFLFLFSLALYSCGKGEGFAPSLSVPLMISPNAITLAVNNTATFTASGGSGSYSFSIFSGSGSVLSTTGNFTAPGGDGTTVVRVVDGQGRYADAIVSINPALQISPVNQSLTINQTQTFTATGGVPPLAFSLASGVGSINSLTGVYTAPATAGTAVVRVTDAIGNISNAAVSIFGSLGISPTFSTIAVNNTINFTFAGGIAPYSIAVLSGTGTINASTGVYTAPAVAGTATIRVTDSVGTTADGFVTVNAALTISPTSQITFVGSSITFTGFDGVTPYTFSVVSGTGTINALSGNFTAPAANEVGTVRVTDAYGNFANATVTVTTPMTLSPSSLTIAVNNTQTFTVAGGTGPFVYSMVSGTGTINAATGVYTAPAASGTATVRVTDSLGALINANVTINPALAISPTSQTTLINSTISFSGTGGVTPYTFAVTAGTGTINSSTGLYTAPAANGTANIRVTDSFGNTANASVIITTVMNISPSAVTLAVNNTQTFTVAGGTGPFVYSLVSGTGTINASTGVYTAPATSGAATVRVTDSLGAIDSATVTINPALAMSPVTQTMGINGTLNFSSSGGVLPYTYSIFSGSGTINASTGVFTAPAAPDTTVVRVTDNYGNTANSTVTVTTGLSISPASTTLAVNNSITFVGASGATPYTYSIFAGGGTINSATGAYTAPATAGTATVRVTDSLSVTADASVTINPALAISPATKTLAVNNSFTFSATGGVTPYTFSIIAGGGTINASSGLYTAPAATGTATVRVTDGRGNTSDSTVTITAALAISPASQIILINGAQTFSGSGGVTPYTYSIANGGGTINSASGLYTAPAANGSATVRVTDSLGNIANAAVTITSPMNISPASTTLAVNNTQAFTVSGGTGPYTYSVFAGGGTVVSATGVYTAPASTGSAAVRVTDSLSATSDATVTINAALVISPVTATIASTGTQQYTQTGGVSPFTYSIVSGPGSINASTGLYTGASAGSVTVRISDSLGNTSDAALTVNGPLSVTPATAYVVVNSDLALSAVGGVAPYTYSIFAQSPTGGVIDAATGVYTAPPAIGTATLRTTDSAAPTVSVDTAVTIYNALTLSPTSLTISINGTQTFTATGGVSTRTFSIFSGTGTINSVTGAYISGPVAGTDLIRVTDTIGNVVQATVTVVSQLSITPAILKLPVFSTMTFTSVLGTTPYTYSVFAGTGTINSATGLYTAPSLASTGTVRVTDAVTNVSDAALTHIEPVQTASGSYHTCVRYNEGSVKCFGLGSSGQLGNGATTNLGDTASTLGGNIPFVNLGTGRTAAAISVGITHSCALLDNASIKCWGLNSSGQLGIGNTTNMGSAPNQMGDSLPAVNLGVGRTASKVFAFGYETCAILDNAVTKCWGLNSTGQLGKDDTVNRGTSAAQMGDSLLAINLGAGRTATKLSGGLDFACALLDNATVKCWGGNRYGQLGYEDTVVRGDNAGEMAALAAVNLGAGRTVLDIGMGYSHSCAVLDNGTAKCWGRNNKGQVGINSNANIIGDGVGEMGDNLIAIPFTSFTPVKMLGGNTMTCAINAAGGVRCWGLGGSGQLLLGSIANIDDASVLNNVNLGTSVVASSISVGDYSVCTITTGKRIKCWGSALNGALGSGQITNNLGDVAGELGDSLPYVNH